MQRDMHGCHGSKWALYSVVFIAAQFCNSHKSCLFRHSATKSHTCIVHYVPTKSCPPFIFAHNQGAHMPRTRFPTRLKRDNWKIVIVFLPHRHFLPLLFQSVQTHPVHTAILSNGEDGIQVSVECLVGERNHRMSKYRIGIERKMIGESPTVINGIIIWVC